MAKTGIKTACVLMCGPEVTMDQRGEGFNVKPVNPLPMKCPHCTFPDLDFVARPYFLGKGISAPTETTAAMFGNFFVRERVRRILELTVPNACSFHPTADIKTKQPTPWFLAVPNRKLNALVPKAPPPFCSKCGEPMEWPRHQGEVWKRMTHYNSRGVDIFETLDWQSRGTEEESFESTNRRREERGLPPHRWSYPGVEPPAHSERWTRLCLERELYFSVRSEQLLKRAKVNGRLRRSGFFADVNLTAEDEKWIQEKLNILTEHGLEGTKPNAGKSSDAAQKWFKQFLKRNASNGMKAIDFATVEAEHKLTLPQDYKDFVSNIGSRAFKNVNGMKVTSTVVLPPQKLDFKNYRRGKVPYLVDEVDGVAFAEMDNGDAFVFDVSVKNNDFPVFWFRHEESTLEPFAPNFAECIKRFVQRD